MAAPSQARWCEFFPDKSRPDKSPNLIDMKWIVVVSSRSIISGMGIVPVHSPAEMLSMERANAKRAASFQERTALSSLFTFLVILPVVRLVSFDCSRGRAS